MTTTPQPSSPAQRLDDLAEIIRAYNQVTENLQKSHESLQAEIALLREQLASTDAQLQRSKRLAALGEMAAGIAHEVRNPLAAIGLYARLIADDLSPLAAISPPLAETTVTAQKIAAAVRGLDAVVGDVLAFSRDLTPKPAACSARALLRRAVEVHRAAIDAAGITVRMTGPDTPVTADPDLMHQALVNVIRNAVEAMTEAPRGERVLALATRREGTQSVLTIRDSGPGIAPEHIDRIFNPFFTTRNTGTGLGLAIVHRIVDAHGGAVSVVNDGGAVFELMVPASAGGRGEAIRDSSELIGATR